MLRCPRCEKDLVRVSSQGSLFWRCGECDGRAVAAAVLRRSMDAEAFSELWEAARRTRERDGGACPSCLQRMQAVLIALDDEALTLDVCSVCQFVWCDAGEFESLPAHATPAEARKELSPEVAEALAKFELEHERRMQELRASARQPELTWKSLPAFLRLPVEVEDPGFGARSWVTWCLSALIAMVSLLALLDLDAVVANWGFLPREPLRHLGTTAVTAFFLHAGLAHLFFNLYFLWIFGDDVEGFLGRGKYLGLILLATIAGCAAHAITTRRPDLPLVGVSDGISGVMAYYAMVFPRARIAMLWYTWSSFGWLNLSARTALVLWLALQVLGTLYGLSDVSHAAHLGGAACGLLLGWFDRPGTRASPSGAPWGGVR